MRNTIYTLVTIVGFSSLIACNQPAEHSKANVDLVTRANDKLRPWQHNIGYPYQGRYYMGTAITQKALLEADN